MYLGHYAVAFAAKRASPGTSLGTLILASQFIDILWPVFVLLGLEKVAIDFFTHAPDLPLYPGSEKTVGLGLWNSLSGTLALELGVFILGVILYLWTTRPANRMGTFSFIVLLVFLIVTYVINIIGPPPPDYKAVAYSALLLWLLVPWGYWVDRNRHLKVGSGRRPGKLKFKGTRL